MSDWHDRVRAELEPMLPPGDWEWHIPAPHHGYPWIMVSHGKISVEVRENWSAPFFVMVRVTLGPDIGSIAKWGEGDTVAAAYHAACVDLAPRFKALRDLADSALAAFGGE